MEIREPINSEYAKTLDTQGLRDNFLVEAIFAAGEICLTYSHVDRVIAGGCMPADAPVVLQAGKEIGADYFLERRELGAINIGGAGKVLVDGEEYAIGPREAFYIGCGTRDVQFSSDDPALPAKFYINSAPAHVSYPCKKITQDMASPETLGAAETSNRRTIYKYLVPDVVDTCQLLMGMTVLEPGSIWNTMPLSYPRASYGGVLLL